LASSSAIQRAQFCYSIDCCQHLHLVTEPRYFRADKNELTRSLSAHAFCRGENQGKTEKQVHRLSKDPALCAHNAQTTPQHAMQI
jgi:hypothetical protein